MGSKHSSSTCPYKAVHGKIIEFLDFDRRRLAFGGYNLMSTRLLTFTSTKVGMTFKLQWVWSGVMTAVSSGNVVTAQLGPSCQSSSIVSSRRRREKGGMVVVVEEKEVGERSWSWQGPGSWVARPGIRGTALLDQISIHSIVSIVHGSQLQTAQLGWWDSCLSCSTC